MSLVNEYDPTDTPQTDFDALPAGDYTVILTEWEDKDTKAGDGQYANLTMEVVDGAYKGRKLWHTLNLKNKSDKAVNIARAQYAAIREAVNTPSPKVAQDLFNKPFVVKVKVERRKQKNESGQWVDDPHGDLQNKCTGFKPLSSVSTTAANGADKHPDGDPWA